MNRYNYYNNLIGWLVFFTALVVYTLTLEPTVSFWDCGEYIATAAKLEVGHPPGAPLFQMIGAFFAMFALGVENVAYMINFMSGLASAFTILFLFWTITHLTRKVAMKKTELTPEKSWLVLGCGVVGALAYTFSDSFWFSAVEGEVYAMSSLLTALLFWLALKWENDFDHPYAHRWLLLISFVIGLSFGIHILSLLVIPAIVFVYFYKQNKTVDTKKFIIANLVAVAILVVVFKIVFPYTLRFFSVLELFFVNQIGLPFNSGSIIAGVLLIVGFVFALRYTREKNLILLNTGVLCLLFMMIGFSSWLMLPIRSNVETNINENSPKSARELLAYYNREQYGDANIFYDTYYSIQYDRKQNPRKPFIDGVPKYEQDKKSGEYIIVNDYKNAQVNYDDKHKGFIPRMTRPEAWKNYKSIAGIPIKSKRRPTFIENIRFMIEYQFGYMYLRYFMWNFVGRQNDKQGNLDIENGNWLSGIKFIDELFLGKGSQTNLPPVIANNKGRNTYYFLPLLLGFLGVFFHFKNDARSAYVLLLLFLFTGLAIIFYTNPKPFEPRERDYAVVGSFYVFAIWIGLGVWAVYEKLKDRIKNHKKLLPLGTFLVCLFAVPFLMGFENWDDHDRSGRYTAHFNAQAYLDSCDKNALMFTIGDNDTFPLWYLQEIEGYRTDIKLVNSSLLATDWYIDQMKRRTYKAAPIPSQLTHKQYRTGSLDVAYFIKQTEQRWDIKKFMRWIASDNKRTYFQTSSGHFEKYYPTNKLRLQIDKKAVLESGLVKPKDSALIVPYIDFDIEDGALGKHRILMLDILANNNWKHPIYFTGGSAADEEYIWLKDYLQLEGMAYKFVPIKTPETAMLDMGRIDTEIMYDRIKKWEWNREKPIKYLDPESRKNSISYRNNMMRLAEKLIEEKKFKKAIEILDLSLEKMPIRNYDYYSVSLDYPSLYYRANATKKARAVISEMANIFTEHLQYYATYENKDLIFNSLEICLNLYRSIVNDATKYEKDKKYLEKIRDVFLKQVMLFEHLIE